MQTITCKECKQEKPSSLFYKMRRHYQLVCKKCRLAKQAIYRKDNKEIIKYRQMTLKFGLSKEQYDTMSERQNHVCAICKRKETVKSRLGEVRRLAVDHCHKTGKVRGLLCTSCNTGIGYFDEDRLYLENAIRYLNNAQSLS